jgi:hypothetical protein
LLPKGIVGLVARRRRGAPGLLAALVKPRDVL